MMREREEKKRKEGAGEEAEEKGRGEEAGEKGRGERGRGEGKRREKKEDLLEGRRVVGLAIEQELTLDLNPLPALCQDIEQRRLP